MRHQITEAEHEAIFDEVFAEAFELYVGVRYFLSVAWNEETYAGTLYDCDGQDFYSVKDFFATETKYGKIKDGKPKIVVKSHAANFIRHGDEIRKVFLRYDSLADAQAHALELLAIAMEAYGGPDLAEFAGIPKPELRTEPLTDEEVEGFMEGIEQMAAEAPVAA